MENKQIEDKSVKKNQIAVDNTQPSQGAEDQSVDQLVKNNEEAKQEDKDHLPAEEGHTNGQAALSDADEPKNVTPEEAPKPEFVEKEWINNSHVPLTNEQIKENAKKLEDWETYREYGAYRTGQFLVTNDFSNLGKKIIGNTKMTYDQLKPLLEKHISPFCDPTHPRNIKAKE